MFDKINSDYSIRVNRSWTFEIPKSVAAMAATASTVPTPLIHVYVCANVHVCTCIHTAYASTHNIYTV